VTPGGQHCCCCSRRCSQRVCSVVGTVICTVICAVVSGGVVVVVLLLLVLVITLVSVSLSRNRANGWEQDKEESGGVCELHREYCVQCRSTAMMRQFGGLFVDSIKKERKKMRTAACLRVLL